MLFAAAMLKVVQEIKDFCLDLANEKKCSHFLDLFFREGGSISSLDTNIGHERFLEIIKNNEETGFKGDFVFWGENFTHEVVLYKIL